MMRRLKYGRRAVAHPATNPPFEPDVIREASGHPASRHRSLSQTPCRCMCHVVVVTVQEHQVVVPDVVSVTVSVKWLNRRGQRPTYNWSGFKQLLRDSKIERPRIVGRPKPRQAAQHIDRFSSNRGAR